MSTTTGEVVRAMEWTTNLSIIFFIICIYNVFEPWKNSDDNNIANKKSQKLLLHLNFGTLQESDPFYHLKGK